MKSNGKKHGPNCEKKMNEDIKEISFTEMVCHSPNCPFLAHTNKLNNNGKYCCLICMNTNGNNHGPYCQKNKHNFTPETIND
jgi:hypothetical protein